MGSAAVREGCNGLGTGALLRVGIAARVYQICTAVSQRPMVGGLEIIDNNRLQSTNTANPPAIHICFDALPRG
jgi:hypothetical protein